jgi:hypothetical protein
MDEMDFEDLHGEPVDLDGCDVTGDPQLDQFGYNSPRRRGQNLSGFRSTDGDRLARVRAQRDEREERRRAAVEQNKAETRQRAAQRRGEPPGIVPFEPGSGYQPGVGPVRQSELPEKWWRSEATPHPVQPQPGPQPGQHGAYFERRVVRRWWAPWTKRTTWQQISAWTHGQPPAGATVVTVADVAQLPGRVHTIGRVSGTRTVEY